MYIAIWLYSEMEIYNSRPHRLGRAFLANLPRELRADSDRALAKVEM
jgi:hypothetical protein